MATNSTYPIEDRFCPLCKHKLELVTRKEEPTLELPEMWKCLCGYKSPRWTTKELGEI